MRTTTLLTCAVAGLALAGEVRAQPTQPTPAPPPAPQPPPIAAAPTDAAAKARFDAGTASYKAGDYALARTEFAAGLAIEPWPGFLFADAQAARLLGDCRSALDGYKAFLAANPPPKARQLALEGIALCAGTDSGTTDIGDKPPPDEPPPPTTDLMSPEPSFYVPTPAERAPRPFPHKLSVGLITAGGIGVVTGATFYVLARRDAGAADDAARYDDAVRLSDRADSRTTIARIAGGVGGALVLAGAIRIVLHDAKEDGSISAAISPDGSFAVMGSF